MKGKLTGRARNISETGAPRDPPPPARKAMDKGLEGLPVLSKRRMPVLARRLVVVDPSVLLGRVRTAAVAGAGAAQCGLLVARAGLRPPWRAGCGHGCVLAGLGAWEEEWIDPRNRRGGDYKHADGMVASFPPPCFAGLDFRLAWRASLTSFFLQLVN